MQPKTNVTVKLIGEDGNAFHILSIVKRALVEAGHRELAQEFLQQAQSGDYDNLLRVVQDFVVVE